MFENEDPKPKTKDVKPSRKDVYQQYFDEETIYYKGEYGVVEGELGFSLYPPSMDAFLLWSNVDKTFLKEGAHVVFRNFDPKSYITEYSYDKLIFENPSKLPFNYIIDNENTYVFLKDGDKIVSSIKLEDYTSSGQYEGLKFARAITGDKSVNPLEMKISGKLKESLVNQLEELVSTGTNTLSMQELSNEQKDALVELAKHLKTDNLKAETSLDIEKAKFKSNNKSKENNLPK
jgi:hypothetical protein